MESAETPEWEEGKNDPAMLENAAQLAGMLASLLFTLQYAPQAVLNWRRKSVKGFSTTGILIKHVGACFLFINTFLLAEKQSVVVYGAFNVMQHSIFLAQFVLYTGKGSESFGLWLFFPLLPLVLGKVWPESMLVTNMVKPLAQVASHLPQLMLCWRIRSTSGVSMMTQHFNIIGGVLGLFMLWVTPPVSFTTYLIYVNSMFQALSLYALGMKFHGTIFQVAADQGRSSGEKHAEI